MKVIGPYEPSSWIIGSFLTPQRSTLTIHDQGRAEDFKWNSPKCFGVQFDPEVASLGLQDVYKRLIARFRPIPLMQSSRDNSVQQIF